MNSINLSLSLLFLTGSVLLAEPGAVALPDSTTPAVGTTVPANDPLVEVLPILKKDYPDFPSLNYKPGDKLEDLVARSNGGISLISQDSGASTPIVTATLPEGVVYCRAASFTPKKSWADLAAEWKDEVQGNHSNGVILDLRSNETPQDIQGAAQMLALLAPDDKALARYKPITDTGGSAPVPAYSAPETAICGPVIILTDQRTTGAAEVLAACLKADGALVLGGQTAGKGAALTEQTLSSGKILRYIQGHINLADGSDLWGRPVAPDIAVTVDNRTEKAALVLIKHNDVLDVIGESPDRHLMSEAALIKGQDPEWDAYLASLEKKPALLSLPIIHDETLISALDSLKAIQVSQRRPETSTTTDATPPVTTSVQ